ncbi:hypothetical protein LINPERHAP1_LOCUS6829 [Linum perenne]
MISLLAFDLKSKPRKLPYCPDDGPTFGDRTLSSKSTFVTEPSIGSRIGQ